jgi:hypothetical protein
MLGFDHHWQSTLPSDLSKVWRKFESTVRVESFLWLGVALPPHGRYAPNRVKRPKVAAAEVHAPITAL